MFALVAGKANQKAPLGRHLPLILNQCRHLLSQQRVRRIAHTPICAARVHFLTNWLRKKC